jgi:hypothetical protein
MTVDLDNRAQAAITQQKAIEVIAYLAEAYPRLLFCRPTDRSTSCGSIAI